MGMDALLPDWLAWFTSTNVMWVLAALVAAILVWIGLLAVRNPVLVKIGLRNIPRRPTQAVLIIVGLTLSTVIIVASLSTGDTLNYSLRRHAVNAYGKIDQVMAPPLLSVFASLAGAGEGEEVDMSELELEGGLGSLLQLVENGLPGIDEARYNELRARVQEEPLIDGVAPSIILPTIVRNVSSGQNEPLGFVFGVNTDYDTDFGLHSVNGEAVRMEDLRPGVGNIFETAANLFGMARSATADLGFGQFEVSDVAAAIAAAGAALTTAQEGDLSAALESLGGEDTAAALEELGITQENLEALGVDLSGATDAATAAGDLLSAINLTTLRSEIDRVLGEVGLELRQGDVYLNRLGAQQLDAQVGDILEVYIGPIPLPYRVKGIVNEAGPMGALTPVVMMPLAEAQQLYFMQGRVNAILVSNEGDEIEGIDHTTAAGDRLRVLALDDGAVERTLALLRSPALRPALDEAAAEVQPRDLFGDQEGPASLDMFRAVFDQAGTMERIRGLPAALDENDPAALRELLARGEIRSWLLSLSLPSEQAAAMRAAIGELSEMELVDPLSKATVVTVASGAGTVFTSVFSVFGIFSILAGVLLIFLIFVMLAAERRVEMGMARAVGVQRSQLVQMFVTEGMVYDLVAAALGVALGLAVSYAMVGFLGGLFNRLSGQISEYGGVFNFAFNTTPTSIIIAYCIGVLFTFIVVTFSAGRVSRLNISTALRDLPEPERISRTRAGRIGQMVAGPFWAALGGYLVYYGATRSLSLVQLGVSLLVLGAAFLARWLLLRRDVRGDRIQRWVYTTIGLGLLAVWGLPWERWLGRSGANLLDQGAGVLINIVLTGPLIILGAIMVVMFNADAFTWLVTKLLGGVGVLTPVLKTAIAYPLSSRFRTGMAMLLFAIIISTVTVMAVVIRATETFVRPDEERTAGFDISTGFSLLAFFNPIGDLEARLDGTPGVPTEQIAAVGAVASLEGYGVQSGPAGKAGGFVSVHGVNSGYAQQAGQIYGLLSRAPGYADDAAVWEALAAQPDVAIVTRDLLFETAEEAGRQQVPGWVATLEAEEAANRADRPDQPADETVEVQWSRILRLEGVTRDDAVLPEIFLELESADPQVENLHRVQVIGVIAEPGTLAGDGVLLNREAFSAITGEPFEGETYYFKAAEGADVRAVAQALESAFAGNAINTTIMAESFAQGQAVTRGVLQLFQGFMALGLLVGIAALGVISSRTVVERRQQVGMLRAIGFQPSMVAFSFLLEASFVAITGLVIGAAAGVLLGQVMVGQFYQEMSGGRAFPMPWGQIGWIVLAAWLFSLLATILPAVQAARIYPAEALRYE